MARCWFYSVLLLFLFASTVFINSSVVSQAIQLNAGYSSDSAGFKRLLIYYGWLSSSNIASLDVDVVVVPGTERILPGGGDNSVVQQLLSRGVQVFAYLEDLNGDAYGPGSDGDQSNDEPIGMGSSFKVMVYNNKTGSVDDRYNSWLHYLEASVDNYIGDSGPIVTGVFLDECDPSYFTSDQSDPMTPYFTQGINDIVSYAHSRGLEVIVNGVMGYAKYGDYYLWEDFLDIFDSSNGRYELITGFLENQSYQSDLEWVNGLSRYYYLKDNGLLEKTLAVSFVDVNHPETWEWGRAAYLLARILGLAGWGYANYTYYSSGGSVPTGLPGAFETGIPVSDPVISEGKVWRFFLASGNTSVSLVNGELAISIDPGYSYPTLRVLIDGENNGEYNNILLQQVNGSYSTLRFVGNINSQAALYFLANWSYNSQASTGGLLHVYLDVDGNSSTGFSVGGMGADYLVEISTDGNGILSRYSGSGNDWSWSTVAYLNTLMKVSGLSYQVEFGIDKDELSGLEESYARFIVKTVYNWNDDASTDVSSIGEMKLLYPTFYEQSIGLDSYTGLVLSTQLSQDRLVLISNGPPGVTVNYTVIVPFTYIQSVLVNGTALSEGINSSGVGWEVKKTWNGYTQVMILAEHHSPINLTITGSAETSPIPELWYPVIGIYIALILFFVYLNRMTK